MGRRDPAASIQGARDDKKRGLVFDIKRYALHDGPGIRTTIFLKGCPLRCEWCDNPESQNSKPELIYWAEKCMGCRRCANACDQGAIRWNDGNQQLIRAKCNLCGKCLEVCYSEALEQVGRYLTVEELINEIEKDRIFYQQSKGGVTLSGGEPTFQPTFAAEILKTCKNKSIHTVLDTCGYADWNIMEMIIQHTDLVLYDLKEMNSTKHKEFIGVSNERILANAEKISQLNIPIVIRIPLIPTFNDRHDNTKELSHFISNLSSVKKIEVLPYHELGIPKYSKLNREYKLGDLKPIRRENLSKIKAELELSGFDVQVSGPGKAKEESNSAFKVHQN